MFTFPYGVNLLQPSAPSQIDRRIYIDSTNKIQSARLIDPLSKDYVLSSNGHFEGMNAIEQRVYLSLLTLFNSSSQQFLGNQFFNIKLITPNIINQASSAAKSALANLINDGSINYIGCNVVNNGNGQIVIQVIWSFVNQGLQKTTNLQVLRS